MVLTKMKVDWKRIVFILTGSSCLQWCNASPWRCCRPHGKAFSSESRRKRLPGPLFVAATWWIFEVIPIGVTSLAIGVVGVLPPSGLLKRHSRTSWIHRSCLFCLCLIGLVFTKAGLTGDWPTRCSRLSAKDQHDLPRAFVSTVGLTHIMAHTLSQQPCIPCSWRSMAFTEKGKNHQCSERVFLSAWLMWQGR